MQLIGTCLPCWPGSFLCHLQCFHSAGYIAGAHEKLADSDVENWKGSQKARGTDEKSKAREVKKTH